MDVVDLLEAVQVQEQQRDESFERRARATACSRSSPSSTRFGSSVSGVVQAAVAELRDRCCLLTPRAGVGR
jgi:hypothetical protein